MIPKENNFLFEHPLDANSVVIEAGAYTGEYAEEIHRRYKCAVYAFEPLKMFYRDAVARLAEKPKVVVSNFAVGADDRIGRITVKGSMTGAFADGDETRECHYISIKKVLEWTEKCDLLALNCEGGEFEILEWLLANDAMKSIPNLVVQFHPVVEHCEWRYNDIQEGLNKTHNPVYSDGWVWQIWRRK